MYLRVCVCQLPSSHPPSPPLPISIVPDRAKTVKTEAVIKALFRKAVLWVEVGAKADQHLPRNRFAHGRSTILRLD